jgi:hypothetical protein
MTDISVEALRALPAQELNRLETETAARRRHSVLQALDWLADTNKKAVQLNGFFALLAAHPVNGGPVQARAVCLSN